MARKNGTISAQPHSSMLAFAESVAQRRASPGVLMFTEKLQLLYLNRQALHFNARLSKEGPRSSSQGLLSPVVYQLCNEIAEHLRIKPDLKEWEHFQIVKIPTVAPPMIIRGIGIPSSRAILILMENLSQRHRADFAIEDNQPLTERERSVVTCLASGMTNRQIAQQLGLSEHTVKDHLKHVMQKTDTHTRTALLVRVGIMANGSRVESDKKIRYGRQSPVA